MGNAGRQSTQHKHKEHNAMHDTQHLSARKAELMIAHDLNDMIEEAINQGDHKRARRYANAANTVLRTYEYVSKDNEGKAPKYDTIEVAGALNDTELLLETVERSPRLSDLLSNTLDSAQSKLARLFHDTYNESAEAKVTLEIDDGYTERDEARLRVDTLPPLDDEAQRMLDKIKAETAST